MAVEIRSLVEDYCRYRKCYEVFLESSSEHQCMRDFICTKLKDILTIVGAEKSTLNVLGVGSGSGEVDLEILIQLHAKHPKVKVENDVVEPNEDMMNKYKDLVSKTPVLNHITYRWNKMTTSEFESDWKQRNIDKKWDLIHLIQMLYCVTDPAATISFFQSLLHKKGKLIIILVSSQSGWARLWRTYRAQLCKTEIIQCITSGDIRIILDAKGIPYQSYSHPSQMDITECFTAGDEKGELMLDFLTLVREFSKCASPELKAGVLELLRHPECSQEVDGRVIFNNNLEALVLNP